MDIETLRTPDERFQGLPGYNYEPHYVDSLSGYEGLRAHYLDLGPKNADQVFLCLHGTPSWSYLYRKMIPTMLETGARVVAPDLFGFGRSDKPIEDSDYTFHFHREFLLRFVEHLALKHITLVVQDWGGTIGLTLPVDAGFRSKLERLIVMNTVLSAGEVLHPQFYRWREFVRSTPDMPVGAVIRQITPQLSDAEVAAYDAPFPDVRYKAGIRRFPELAMLEPESEGAAEVLAALDYWKNKWSGKSFMAVGTQAEGKETMDDLHKQINGCPEPFLVSEGHHFLPEWGEKVIQAALKSFAS